MLAGVAQALVQRGLGQVGLTGRTEPVHAAGLDRFDAAFLCNSATPSCAVAAIDGHNFPPAPGLIDRLEAAWMSNRPEPI
jgi:branched-subunit amino acid aminotransferase/4-amino-4-deoxychorismate lyase